MTLETVLSTLALIVATVAAVATIAGLSDAGRERLAKWTRTAASRATRVVQVSFFVGILLNGIGGIVLFGTDSSPLTRADILKLLLFLTNVAMGLWELGKLAERRATERAAEKATSEELFLK